MSRLALSISTGRRRPQPRRTPARRPQLEQLEGRALLAAWVQQGPAAVFGGQVEGIVGGGTAASPNNPVSGAVEALAAHPTDPNILYAATVGGGVWRTNNSTALQPTWTPLTDQMPTLSSGDIEFDPNDATNQTLWVGTGPFSSFGYNAPGQGLLKTTDGGASWSVVNPGGIFTNRNIKSVIPTTLSGGQVILVGTFQDGGGVYRSTNGGTSFTRVSGSAGLPNAGVSHLVRDPLNASRFYAGVPNFGVYRSDDGGATWTAKNSGIVNPANANSRVELAPSPAQSGVVFAALLRNGQAFGFYRSTNAGDTWTAMDLAGTNEGGNFIGVNPREKPGSQGWIHFSMLADRTNPNVVFVGGDRQPTGGNGGFPNSIGANNFSGRLFRGDASLAAGSQWAPVTNNGADPDGTGSLPGTSPHADSRDMVWDANGNIVEGDDGGVYRLLNPNVNAAAGGRRWTSVHGNMVNTEFHSVAYSSLTNTMLGGTQDVGTPIQISTNPASPWAELIQGDGGVVAADDVSQAALNRSVRYTSFQNFQFFNRTVWNASNQVLSQVAVGLSVGGNSLFNVDGNIRFYQPYELNAINPTRMLIPTASLYESFNQGDTLTSIVPFTGFFNTGLVYGGRFRGVDNPGLVYMGVGASVRYRSADGQPFTTLPNYPGSAPLDLTVDPQNSRRLFVLDSSDRVWATFNLGASWINLTSNLASLAPTGISDLQTIAFVGNSTNYDNAILTVGGWGGAFALRSPGLAGTTTTWADMGTGLSNAVVMDLRYDAKDNILVAGTLGRGAWSLSNPGSEVPAPGPLPGPLPSLPVDPSLPLWPDLPIAPPDENPFPADPTSSPVPPEVAIPLRPTVEIVSRPAPTADGVADPGPLVRLNVITPDAVTPAVATDPTAPRRRRSDGDPTTPLVEA
jgi:hypothetical protein